MQRVVALKLLTARRAEDRRWRHRFLTEARAASALNHPNVCVIYDVGETDERRPYLAMEYVEGLTLQALLREAPEVVEMAIQMADALDVAYHRGIVHRDIKTSNICITERGQVKILDFGLAKRFGVSAPKEDQDTTLHETAPGEVRGRGSRLVPSRHLV